MTHRAVVSLLDADHEVAVRRIWDRLAEHGLETDLWVTPIPHITYHVAEAYQDNMVENLSLVAGETRPFGIRTAGLGMFPGESPVEHSPRQRDRRRVRRANQAAPPLMTGQKAEVTNDPQRGCRAGTYSARMIVPFPGADSPSKTSQ